MKTKTGINPSKIGINPSTIGINPSKIGINPSTIGINPSTIGINPSKIGIKVVLFDLGGVLIDFIGMRRIRELMPVELPEEELWRIWLTSRAVRRHDAGKSKLEEFVPEIVSELKLRISEEDFLKEFNAYKFSAYPGVENLLKELAESFTVATLSNMNETYWVRIYSGMPVMKLFKHYFASCRIGFVKPDKEAYQYAVDVLGCKPDEILFFDDNKLNVEGAKSAGLINSYRVFKVSGVREQLEKLGLLGKMTEDR